MDPILIDIILIKQFYIFFVQKWASCSETENTVTAYWMEESGYLQKGYFPMRTVNTPQFSWLTLLFIDPIWALKSKTPSNQFVLNSINLNFVNWNSGRCAMPSLHWLALHGAVTRGAVTSDHPANQNRQTKNRRLPRFSIQQFRPKLSFKFSPISIDTGIMIYLRDIRGSLPTAFFFFWNDRH